eukprot:scaffold21665_cov60-Cyclotella_meneghiniana.AAC.1
MAMFLVTELILQWNRRCRGGMKSVCKNVVCAVLGALALRKRVQVAVPPISVGCWLDMIHRKIPTVLCVTTRHTSFAHPSMLEGTLFDVARFRAHWAFGLDVEILGRDLGGVPYRKPHEYLPQFAKWTNGD